MLNIKALAVARCPLDLLLDQLAVLRVNSREDEFQRRLNLLRTLKDSERLVGPEYFPTRDAPAKTSCVAERLCLGKICLSTLQLLGELLLLSDIYPCSNEPCESLPVSPRSAHAAHTTNLSIWPHNPFCEVESAMLD